MDYKLYPGIDISKYFCSDYSRIDNENLVRGKVDCFEEVSDLKKNYVKTNLETSVLRKHSMNNLCSDVLHQIFSGT